MTASVLALALGAAGMAIAPAAFAATTTSASAHSAVKAKAKTKSAKTKVAKAPAAPLVSVASQEIVDWVTASSDNHGLPFIVIDKVAAETAVYDAQGQLISVAPALVGAARGDGSSPGVGDRELSDIAPEDRTTPAGRFVAGFAPAFGGKPVLWVDYATAISLHPVVTSNPSEHRPQRLRSPTPDDNRITFGCINVAASFYKNVVLPALAGGEAVVYVLPEEETIEAAFPSFRQAPVQQQAKAEDAPAVAETPVVAATGAGGGS